MSIEIVLIGLLVGSLVGMTGVGGAALLTPILVLMGINPAIAIGTDFAYNTITKLFGALQHIRQKTVNFQLVKYLAIGSLPAAIAANLVFYSLLSEYYNEKLIVLLLGLVLITVSVITLIQFIFIPNPVNGWKMKPLSEKRLFTIIAGLIIGAIVVDPEFDDNETIQRYAQVFQADSGGWKWLRGTTEETKGIAAQFQMNFKKGEDNLVAHNTTMYLVDEKNWIRATYDMANTSKPVDREKILRDIHL